MLVNTLMLKNKVGFFCAVSRFPAVLKLLFSFCPLGSHTLQRTQSLSSIFFLVTSIDMYTELFLVNIVSSALSATSFLHVQVPLPVLLSLFANTFGKPFPQHLCLVTKIDVDK